MLEVVSKRPHPTDCMNNSSKKCRKRKKRKRGKMDKISELPEHLLHQILTRLHSKDAARTSTLSKTWKEIWDSYQVLDFDLRYDCNVSDDVKELYKNQINRLQRIQKLRLCFTKSTGLTIDDVNDWIGAAMDRGVRELEFQVKGIDNLSLPSRVMHGNLITALNLQGCNIRTYFINLPQLQKLSLKNLNIYPGVFEALIAGCPYIEDLRLIQCAGFKKLSISNLDRLKRVDLHKCLLLRNVVIKVQSLETFWYYSDKKKKTCEINIEECRALRELTVEYPRMTDEVFHGKIYELGDLEKLVLSRCNGLKSIALSGCKLRNLVIRRCRNLKEARCNTPNLTSLEYTGQRMPLLFTDLHKLNKALLSFDRSSTASAKWKGGGDDASRLTSFLHQISYNNGLKSMSVNELDTVIYEDIRAMLLPLHYISNPWAVQISLHFQDLLDAALKNSPFPSTLSIMSHFNSDFPEIIHRKLMKEKATPQCCGCFTNKCWRHYLKNVSIEKWILDTTELQKPSESHDWKKSTFRLEWKY